MIDKSTKSILSVSKVCFFIFASLLVNSAFGTEGGTEENLVLQGRRYFLGLLPINNNQKSCSECHYQFSSESDSILWGPSILELHEQSKNSSSEQFISKLSNPSGKRAQEVHGSYELNEEELDLIYQYLKSYEQPTPKPVLNRLIIFLLLGLMITWSLAELLVFRRIKIAFIPISLLMIGLFLQLGMVHIEALRIGRNKGYAPDQPIRFSHKIHAKDNQMDCKYCHNFAEHNKSSGIPAASLCMNCHVLIRKGTYSGGFEIAKVVNRFESKTPIQWTRVHNLPDHVYYNHAQHVNVANLDCAECHGEVESMGIMKQHSDLSMGWCVNCHRETKINGFHTSGYYKSLGELQTDLGKNGEDPVAEDIGANDCMRCHY